MELKSISLTKKIFQFLVEQFGKNLNFWLVCTICISNESWKHSNIIFGIKDTTLQEIFFKNWIFKIFCHNCDEKKFFGSFFFKKILYNPPKQYSPIVLNTKNGIYKEVSQAQLHKPQKDKSLKIWCVTLIPPHPF